MSDSEDDIPWVNDLGHRGEQQMRRELGARGFVVHVRKGHSARELAALEEGVRIARGDASAALVAHGLHAGCGGEQRRLAAVRGHCGGNAEATELLDCGAWTQPQRGGARVDVKE